MAYPFQSWPVDGVPQPQSPLLPLNQPLHVDTELEYDLDPALYPADQNPEPILLMCPHHEPFAEPSSFQGPVWGDYSDPYWTDPYNATWTQDYYQEPAAAYTPTCCADSASDPAYGPTLDDLLGASHFEDLLPDIKSGYTSSWDQHHQQQQQQPMHHYQDPGYTCCPPADYTGQYHVTTAQDIYWLAGSSLRDLEKDYGLIPSVLEVPGLPQASACGLPHRVS